MAGLPGLVGVVGVRVGVGLGVGLMFGLGGGFGAGFGGRRFGGLGDLSSSSSLSELAGDGRSRPRWIASESDP